MSSQALIDAVAESQNNGGRSDDGGRFDVSSDVFESFEERLEELHWRETSDGTLLVGDAARSPEAVVSIRLQGATLEAEQEDPQSVDWDRARVVSEPGTASSPQYD